MRGHCPKDQRKRPVQDGKGGAICSGTSEVSTTESRLRLPAVAQVLSGTNPASSLSMLRKGRSGMLMGSCSHHQGGLGHRWLGSWGPGRSCNHHSGPSTSRCCHQRCPPVVQVPEGATPSTGQRGRVSREARHPIPPRSLPHEPHQAFLAFESVGTF